MQRNSRSLFRLYLLPAVGARKVADVRWEDLERIHRELRDRPYQANRFLAAYSKAWALAARWGWWPREMPNPAQGHDQHHEERRGQALDMPGLACLGDALRQEHAASMPVAAFTFMLLIGCRPGEARRRPSRRPVTAIPSTRPIRPAWWSTSYDHAGLPDCAGSRRHQAIWPSPAARPSCASKPIRGRPSGWRSMKSDRGSLEHTPSDADLQFTRRMAYAATLVGVELIDHLVLGAIGLWVSIRAQGGW